MHFNNTEELMAASLIQELEFFQKDIPKNMFFIVGNDSSLKKVLTVDVNIKFNRNHFTEKNSSHHIAAKNVSYYKIEDFDERLVRIIDTRGGLCKAIIINDLTSFINIFRFTYCNVCPVTKMITVQ